MERRNEGGRVVALDEAHQFLTTNSREAITLTDNYTIVTHSLAETPGDPAWFATLRGHLAGAVLDESKPKYSSDNIFFQNRDPEDRGGLGILPKRDIGHRSLGRIQVIAHMVGFERR
ncbi:uncharacterized protein PADG_11216 [Paracoccidioides brasiliensis Pb18]|uniref:Uncharacterized protein n=1 Tax=Paracoccidioides brasiliensis (strain Pb18) TaxID=502780 RepID=A0A0A0HWN0_PARBD|nr:uncharacterized protein PADG_11216 [Paracoccidioides brasiliensis Pb18]KGM92758.1 hypothetical protein PADG_11216 [Paracoccidioides brasiliensis Pb18]